MNGRVMNHTLRLTAKAVLLMLPIWAGSLPAQQAGLEQDPARTEIAAVAAPEEEEEPRSYAAPWQSRPTLARMAVVNASGTPTMGNQVALLLSDLRRLALERKMGMRLEVVNMSNTTERLPQTVIYYRDGFLRAALTVAEQLPGDQSLAPMSPPQTQRAGIDVEIWLGKELP